MSRKHTSLRALAAAALMALPALAFAQSYYDDDIYFDGAKADKERQQQLRQLQQLQQQQQQQQTYYTPTPGRSTVVDMPGADQYYVNSGSTRNVDEYNRHGQFLVVDSVAADSAQTDYFANTRRIERFHNSDIVSGSSDIALQDYYYAEPLYSNVNIIVGSPSWYPLDWSLTWGTPWYGRWGWGGLYDPWFSWGWGPSWSWSWGWGPSWAWGPSWGWGPSWAWGGPGWGGPVPPRPSTGIGSSGTHRPTYAGGGSRNPVGANNGYRPGYYSSGAGTRPGNAGYGSGSASRPGSSGMAAPAIGGTSRPSNTQSTAGSTVVPTRGRNNTSTSTPSRTQSWGGSSSSPSRNTGGFNSGGSRGGYSGGGSRSGGGGGGGRGRH